MHLGISTLRKAKEGEKLYLESKNIIFEIYTFEFFELLLQPRVLLDNALKRLAPPGY